MFFLLKVLLGASAIGGGVILPIAITKGVGEAGKTVGETINRIGGALLEVNRREVAKNKENNNLSEVFKDLGIKGCKLIQNPAGSKDDFHAIYACKKDEEGPTNFYYVGSRDTAKLEGKNLIKEIETVDYKGLERGGAQLELKFKDKSKEIMINVMGGEGGWSYFKNVNLSQKCNIETKKLGGDDLRCELTDAKGKTFFYNFSIF